MRKSVVLWTGVALATAGWLVGGCRNSEEIPAGLRELGADEVDFEWDHRGPGVVFDDAGTARFARRVFEAFDVDRAMETVAFTDRYYRAPANDGYEAVLDRVASQLKQAGFGSHVRLKLFEYESAVTSRSLESRDRVPAPAWTPLSASLTLKVPGERDRVLHSFENPGDVDRVMLPINAISADVEGPVALHLEELDEGEILVIEAPAQNRVVVQAKDAGAVAVVSASLYPFNQDTTGAERQLDGIHFRHAPIDSGIPMAQISPRSYSAIRDAVAADPNARVQLKSEVRFDERPLRTLVALILGSDRAHEAVALMSHVQEPGACDNASGVGGLLEAALTTSKLLRDGQLEWPSRTLAFIWGDEFRMTEAWLEQTDLTPVAGISTDMIGQSRDRTGAMPLLERMPDPGALVVLDPDEHTPWGASPVEAEDLSPNGFSVIARCALADVARLTGGDWGTVEHPWEGGSDHDVFIERGLPAVLFWHFTDFSYHTSLDRLDMVDAEELHRTATAIVCTALAMADPRPEDLDRYIRSLEMERVLRTGVAREAADEELAKQWDDWCYAARQWLRSECLRISGPAGGE